jgi:hypothetical protein
VDYASGTSNSAFTVTLGFGVGPSGNCWQIAKPRRPALHFASSVPC